VAMFLLIAVAMGYLISTNAWVETQVQRSIGASYANSTLGRMSSLGGFASWTCIWPSAYFYSVSDYDKTYWHGLLFFVCSLLGGSVVSALINSRGLRYRLSPFAIIINPALTCLTYFMSVHQEALVRL
jgi:hypothetical protein